MFKILTRITIRYNLEIYFSILLWIEFFQNVKIFNNHFNKSTNYNLYHLLKITVWIVLNLNLDLGNERIQTESLVYNCHITNEKFISKINVDFSLFHSINLQTFGLYFHISIKCLQYWRVSCNSNVVNMFNF